MKTFLPQYGCNDFGVADFAFSFLPNGTGAVDQNSIRGLKVASVTRTGVGVFSVVLDGPYYQLTTKRATLDDDAAPSAGHATVYCPDEGASPLVLTIRTKDAAGAVTDYTGRRVNCNLTIRTSIGR